MNDRDAGEQSLHAEIARLGKIIQVLMDRVENISQGSDFNLFQTTITLEEQVHRRTGELEHALRENERITRALRESEEHNRLLVENSPLCIHEIDINGKIASMNRAGLIMLGLRNECDVLGYPYLDAVDTVDRERITALLKKAYEGESSQFEFRASGPTGQIYKSCFVPIRNEAGSIEKLMGISEDITERKCMEQQLVERKTLFMTIFNQSSSGIELIDPETLRFVEANPAACNMLGYTHDEFVRLRLADTQADLNETKLSDLVRQADTSGGMTFENRHRCKNGEILDVEIYARMLELPGKRLMVGMWRDITASKRIQENLAAREREFRTLSENSPDNIARHDCNGRLLYANPALLHTLGRPVQDLLGKTPLEVIPGESFRTYQNSVLHVGATGESVRFEQIIQAPGEPQQIHSIRMVAELGQDGKPVGVLAVGRDITEIKRAEENLRIIASVFDNSQEGIVITDAESNFVAVNSAFTRITGYSREEVIGKNPAILHSGRQDKAFYAGLWQSLEQKKSWRGEMWNRRKSGEFYAELLSITAICAEDGKVQRYVGVFSDISYIKAHEIELNRVANYDALTGIPNRRLLSDRLDQAIARTKRRGGMLAVCYLDLDGFKEVNDRYGHEAGDQLLTEVSRRLQEILRDEDTLARLGGDEFVALFNNLYSQQECNGILERILSIVAMPVHVGDHTVAVSASIGVAFHTDGNEDGDILLRHADQAMYVAKQSGKGRYHLYGTV